MPIKFVQQQKTRQMYLIATFVAIIVVIGVILWFGFLKEERVTRSTVVVPMREVKIDFEFLKSQEMKDLQVFKEVSPFGGEKGRENPFLSIGS